MLDNNLMLFVCVLEQFFGVGMLFFGDGNLFVGMFFVIEMIGIFCCNVLLHFLVLYILQHCGSNIINLCSAFLHLSCIPGG